MQLFWIGTLTRNAVHALEVLSYKSSTSPSTPHSGEIRMSQKKHLMSLLDDATTAVKRLNRYFCFLLLGFHLPVREKWAKMYKSVSQHNYLSIFLKTLSFSR